ncbi:OTU domain [Trinorchestia longiramus]|nr:OTU domain [Trinorchestia longiramus]
MLETNESQCNGPASASVNNNHLTEEDLLVKHKAEKKELQATIQQLKKNAQNSKKKKKEAVEEISKLETEMKARHLEELSQCKKGIISNGEVESAVADLSLSEGAVDLGEGETPISEKSVKVSRAAKRRAKKAEAAEQREMELQQEREHQQLYSPRAVEARLMAKLISERQLRQTEVQPDGNCMYSALSLQLEGAKSVENLRCLASDYMLEHKDDFLPFLTAPDTGELLDERGFQDYCDKVASTSAWGGQPELRALSQVLRRKIEVLQAEGAPMVLGEEFSGDPLLLAYYRHSFSLGEHYNSLRKRTIDSPIGAT